jgi:glycosyltransferase involved in cell wall biosynthesis
LPETPVRWIPNGVDTERYSPASPERRARLRAELGWDQTPRVLFVGRLVAKKGAEIAVQSAEASGGRWKVVLAGPGTLPGAMSAHAELVGPLPPERVADLYRAADAFLLPSHGEGFPVTAQEALASGLPVFLGEDASYAPYLKHPGPGLRLIPRAPDVIAARLTAFLADAEERQRAQADALAQARRLFSWGTTVDAHLEFIEELRTRLVPSR